MVNLLALAAALALPSAAAPARPKKALDADKIEGLLKEKGTVVEGQFKLAVPQQELRVSVDGFSITPPMGLTTWIAFSPHGEGVMAMGDVVLLEDEVAAAQRAALAGGLSVTALHNHFLRDSPKVMFMHVEGMGPLETLTAAVRRLLDEVRALRAAKKMQTAPWKVSSSLDVREISKTIGHPGLEQDGVFKIVVGRPEVALKDASGAPVNAFMGFNTWMAFQGTPEKAAVAGDFAMREGEVAGVVKALVDGGLEVTAIHNHMIAESPRIVFLHFWGVGPSRSLAAALRSALDQTAR